MIEIGRPYHIGEINGVPVRTFRPRFGDEQMPWVCLDDITMAAGITPASRPVARQRILNCLGGIERVVRVERDTLIVVDMPTVFAVLSVLSGYGLCPTDVRHRAWDLIGETVGLYHFVDGLAPELPAASVQDAMNRHLLSRQDLIPLLIEAFSNEHGVLYRYAAPEDHAPDGVA